ncbi:MAG: hypothetical protein HY332_22440 [Chloroflexi bacterium]|nr:hypothetical protein [Chloroflexota bacterium]
MWVSHEPRRLAIAPDGQAGYVLGGDGCTLTQLDLVGGGQQHLHLPGHGLDVLATTDRVYVTNPYGSDVWAVDPRTSRVVSIAAGRRPIALVAHRRQAPIGVGRSRGPGSDPIAAWRRVRCRHPV